MTLSELRKHRIDDLVKSGIELSAAINRAYLEITPHDLCIASATTVANSADAAGYQSAFQKKRVAREEFHGHVHRVMREQHVDSPEADRRCRTLYATLANEMDAPLPVAGRNSEASGTGGVNSSGLSYAAIQRLCLPDDCLPDELAAALAAGTGDPAKLFPALVKWVQETRNFSFDAAQGFCLGRFACIARGARIQAPAIDSSSGKAIQLPVAS